MHDNDAYSRDRREIGYGSIEEIQTVLDRLAANAPKPPPKPFFIEPFEKLDGTTAEIDLRDAELWPGGGDEGLARVGGLFVLMHPDRLSRETEPEAAAHWFRHHFGAQPLPEGFPRISRETPSLAAWWRGEGPGAGADPAPRTEATLPTPAVATTARHIPEAEEGQQAAPEPPAATAPTPAARPTPEDERQGKTPSGATDCHQGLRTKAVEEHKRQSRRFRRGELDDKAHQLLSLVPGLTNKEIAEQLGCHLKSLSNPKLIKFQMLREELTRRKEEFRDLSRDGSKPPTRRKDEDDR